MDGYLPSTYGDAFADVYDDWYEDTSDVSAAVATIAGIAAGRPVLELGVGSGRLAVPLAAAGTEVWGVDASPAMLERLAARPGGAAVRAVEADMVDPAAAVGPGAPAFGAVVCAFNTFFLLTSEGDQLRCASAVTGLLAPGGRLVIEAFVPAGGGDEVEQVLEPRIVALDRVVLSVSRHEPMEQTVTGQHIEIGESGIRLRPWVLRYCTPTQLDAIAAAAGLRLVERWGSWDRRPFTPDSSCHVSVYGVG